LLPVLRTGGGYLDLATANAWTGHDKDAREAVIQLQKIVPNATIQSLLRGALDEDPTFNAELARIFEGVRKAGMPEGEAKTN
jgi:hypothetical protein